MILGYCCGCGSAFLYKFNVKGNGFINIVMPIKTQNYNQYLTFMIDKSYLSEYTDSNSSLNEGLWVKEEFFNISQEDENAVIKYLLDIMITHDIITEEEYQAVLYKYN